jgi:hypothetical protein
MPGGPAAGYAIGHYGIGMRDPYKSEDDYFKKNPHVAGMAAEDDKIVMNPYSKLSEKEKQAVILNEAARVHMRTGMAKPPRFTLTPEQERAFAQYSQNPEDRAATVAARLLSGDPSALKPTPEQMEYVNYLRAFMGVR